MTNGKSMKDLQLEVDSYISQFQEGYLVLLAMLRKVNRRTWRICKGSKSLLRGETKENK